MAGINKVIIVGNLGRDPEVRFTQSGTAVCNLNIAVTERIKQGDEWKDATEWFRAVCFGKLAENAGKYLVKGRQVYVEGRLQTKKYTDKDGNERTITDVIANTVQFLGGGGTNSEASERSSKPTGRPKPSGGMPAPDVPGMPADGFIDDDLPF